MTRLAIMQPYFFPYIGYWQLMHAVDRFMIYDDVSYIRHGWINRNRILINACPAYIIVPLHRASSNKRICDIDVHPASGWRDRLIKKLEITYRRAPGYPEVFPVIERLIRHEAEKLSDYLAHQLRTLAAFMGIATEFVTSSRRHDDEHLSGQDRVLEICKREGADTYINLQGGQVLYDPRFFRSAGVDLRFLVMRPLPYKQRAGPFIPYLSIIDALMEIGPAGLKEHLAAHDLIGGEIVPRTEVSREEQQSVARSITSCGQARDHLPIV